MEELKTSGERLAEGTFHEGYAPGVITERESAVMHAVTPRLLELHHRRQNLREELADVSQAIAILTQHPEFEQFLSVQKTLQRY